MAKFGLALANFVGDMAYKLEANHEKPDWNGENFSALFHSLCAEGDELQREIDSLITQGISRERLIMIIYEAADVANLAMMIADKARNIKLELDSELISTPVERSAEKAAFDLTAVGARQDQRREIGATIESILDLIGTSRGHEVTGLLRDYSRKLKGEA